MGKGLHLKRNAHHGMLVKQAPLCSVTCFRVVCHHVGMPLQNMFCRSLPE